MKKSQQANQSNTKSAQSARQSKTRARTTTKAKNEAKISSSASDSASTTSRHFGTLSRFSCPATKSTPARHFRANSYVPLLLALRPRAGGSVSLDKSTAGLTRLGKLSRLSKPMMPTASLVLSLIFISSLFGLVVFPTSASAANLTLTIPSNTLLVKATPNQFSKSEAQSISVSTDSVGGYTLKLSSKNGNTLNNTSNGGASKINPISEELTETAFSTSGNNNVWGFKPSKLRGVDNSDEVNGKFIAAPTQGESIILDTTNTSNIEGGANNYDITLGVKVDSTLPAGSYSNTFVLTATVNALKYDITYDAGNAEDEVTNMPDPKQVTGETPNTSITLTDTIPEWSGYVFQGWCTVKPVMKSGRDDCEGSGGTKYSSGAEFPLTMASTTTTLYAMWNELLLTDVIEPETGKAITFKVGDGIELVMVASSRQETQTPPIHPESPTTTKWWPFYAIQGTDVTMDPPEAGEKFLITVVPQKNNKFTKWQKNEAGTEWTAMGETGSYKTMQELTQDECAAAGAGGMNVTDTRNNVSYTVGMVGDFCWMYSNLRLEGGTELTSTDSDLGAGMTFQVPKSAKANDTVAGEGGVWVNYWSKKEMIECKGKAGQDVTLFEANGGDDQNRTCADNTSAITEFYYNWYASIANDAEGDTPTNGGSYEEGSVENAGLDQQAKGSICPKNWRLLEEGAAGDGKLITSHDEIDAFATAQNANLNNNLGRLATAGKFWTGQQHYVGVISRWGSASRHSDANVRGLDFSHSGAYFYDNNKNDGNPVRCTLRND